jgi:predicted alpha/beta superfamily hydrolase
MFRTQILVAVLGLLVAQPVLAQNDGDPVSIGTYRVIESEALGETRRLLVHLPRGYEGSNITYPVLYHTYGDYIDHYYTEAVRTVELLANDARAPQIILVGIDNIDRYRDLRPLKNDRSPAGIENYVRFLTGEVFPFVEKNYRTAGYRIVAGPQAGAVFCLYALMFHPDLFDAFILNNPLVHGPSTELLFAKAGTFFGEWKSPMNKYFFVTYGAADERPEHHEYIERLGRQTAHARAKGFDLRLNELVGNTDFIPPLHLEVGIARLFADYHVPLDSTFGSLEAIQEHYAGLSKRYGFDVAPSEMTMTFSADALLQNGNTEGAVEILEYETTLYPNMVNPWWRLANIAAEGGDTKRAIELFNKCVEINPSMKNFVDRRIESLKKDG